MKRLLLPLLAALALPTAVKAESFYLLVNIADRGTTAESSSSFIVPMKTLAGCEEVGVKLISSDRFKTEGQEVHFECIEKK